MSVACPTEHQLDRQDAANTIKASELNTRYQECWCCCACLWRSPSEVANVTLNVQKSRLLEKTVAACTGGPAG